jgi:phosphoribosylglycinamide formyltransferase-1
MIKQNIAIFASGTGSNALNLIRHFKETQKATIAFVLTNKGDAPVVTSAEQIGVPVIIISNDQATDGSYINELLQQSSIDLIILAGYLRKIPVEVISSFPEKILNVHPSLLPKYGGKNMYGDYVHLAVLEANEKVTGITFHWVNEEFDKGRILAQFSTSIEDASAVEEIRHSVQQLEHEFFPTIVDAILNKVIH